MMPGGFNSRGGERVSVGRASVRHPGRAPLKLDLARRSRALVCLGDKMMLVRLACLFVSLLLLAPAAPAQQIRLKTNLQFPIDNPTFGAGLARLKEEVERSTENAVILEIFDKSQLFSSDQVVDAVASGAIDLGIASSQQFSFRAPLVGILDQPFVFNFQALIDAVAKPGSEIRKLIDDAILSEIGVRVLWWQSIGNNVLFSKGDVADPALLKGKRVATPSKRTGEFAAWCGGVPVALTIEKFQGGLRDGTLDMAVVGLSALRNLGLWKVTDTVTFTLHSPVEFLLIVNEKKWQTLSPAHREAIAQAARRVESGFDALRVKTDAAMHGLAASKNVKLKALTADQVADWRACSAGMLADFMERNGEAADKLMAAYSKLRTDPCCSSMPGEDVFTRR
jgi:C4-dicarboxylate-binding protein DctP